MNSFEAPHFVTEGEQYDFPALKVGNVNRNRAPEYKRLFEGEKHYTPVVCLTIFSTDYDTGDIEILVGVRDPEENFIHPNVVSTPTQRITKEALIEDASDPRRKLVEQSPNKHVFSLTGEDWFLPYGWLHCRWPGPTQITIENVLEQKLGVDNTPDKSDKHWALHYRSAVHSITLGDSRAGVTDDWRDITEKVAMVNILVEAIGSLKESFPAKTKHYSDIRWVSLDEYRSMQDTKNLLPVFDINAVQLCMHGVCVATSRTAIDDMQDFLTTRYQPGI